MTHHPEARPDAVGPVARKYAQQLRATAESVAGLGLTPDQRDSLIISANLLESIADGYNVITPRDCTGYRLHFVGDQADDPVMQAAEGLLRGVHNALAARAQIVRATMTPDNTPAVLVMSCAWTQTLKPNLPAVDLGTRRRALLRHATEHGYTVEWIESSSGSLYIGNTQVTA